jgi:hypothetical protein
MMFLVLVLPLSSVLTLINVAHFNEVQTAKCSINIIMEKLGTDEKMMLK